MAGCRPRFSPGTEPLLVLVTRPREQAADTARRLRLAGHEALIDPVLDIRSLPVPAAPADAAAIAVTSANAVPALRGLPAGLPVYAVGEATARALQAAGRPAACVADGEGAALAGLIRRAVPPPATILHPCGRDVREGLEQALVAAGYRYVPLVSYEAVPATALGPVSAHALAEGRIDAGLFFSPRSAGRWAELVGAAGLSHGVRPMLAACLSPAVATELRSLPFRRIRIAESRDQKALLRCLEGPG